jgi:hypothetical protein
MFSKSRASTTGATSVHDLKNNPLSRLHVLSTKQLNMRRTSVATGQIEINRFALYTVCAACARFSGVRKGGFYDRGFSENHRRGRNRQNV